MSSADSQPENSDALGGNRIPAVVVGPRRLAATIAVE